MLILAASPVHAQSNGVQDNEWRVFLPSPTTTEASRTSPPDVALPTLTRNDLPPDDRQQNQEAGSQRIRIGSVLIEATAPINHAMFDQAIEPFLGTDASNQDLAKLAQEIAEVARSAGMMLADTHVPPQQVEMGIVKIVLTVGQIDEVRVEGSSNRALRDLLEPLVGKAVMQADLERRLMLAGNIPRINVRRTEIVNDGGRRILLVHVKERDAISGQLSLDNFGSSSIGPVRARLSAEAVALLDDSDYLNVTIRTNPADPKEFVAGSSVYGIGLNDNGTRAEIAAAWSKSDVDPRFGFGRRDGESRYASLAINHPLRRSRTSNLWVEGQFEYLKIEQQSFGAILQNDTVVTASVGVSSSLKTGNGWLRTGVQLRQGLGILGANQPGDPFASRFDADGQFTSARAWANWSGKPVAEMTLRIAVSGQVASEPLLSSEEMGLGGAYTGRAFDFFDRSGDQGVLALVEAGYEFSKPVSWIKRLQPYAFVDGGYVDNLRAGYGSGTLISAGGGVRADIGAVNMQIETAVPLHESGSPDNDSAPKLNLQLGVNF
jgi:hemolysin activation/secretion protein